MTLQRSDVQALAWRLSLLAIAIIALAYSSIRKIAFEPDTAMVNRPGMPLEAAGLGKLSLFQGNYKSIAEHPLFEPSRQRWAPTKRIAQDTSLPKTTPQAPTGYVLVGLILSADQDAALLRENSGKTRILRVGSKIDGWSVKYIDAVGVRLYSGDSTFLMTMHKQAH